MTPEHRVAYTIFWFKGPEKGGVEDVTPYDRFKCLLTPYDTFKCLLSHTVLNNLSHTVLNNLASQS